MKILLRVLAILVLIIGLAALALVITGNSYIFKGLQATYFRGETSATIEDAQFFQTRTVEATHPEPWEKSGKSNQIQLSDRLVKTLKETESVAFLIIKNGEILYENYWEGYSDTSHSNSFSAAKSITTMLAQRAIQDGYFKSWDDKLIDYLPDLKGEFREDLQLKHLSQMTAGLDWNEDYHSPFDITARAYYSADVEEVMLERVPVYEKPGSRFEYQSGATQFLGMAIIEATGKPLADYAAETLWKDLRATQNARWHLDDSGLELAYCCFNTNARDFARFGQMVLNHGKWEGKTVLDSAFLHKATRPAATDYYGWSFWIDTDDHGMRIPRMSGLGGQYIIAVPERDLVIVRLGREKLPNTDNHPEDFHIIMNEILKLFDS